MYGTDPILSDFHGRTFEFEGEHAKIYSVLSSFRHVINMQLVAAGPRHRREQLGNGTFVETLGLQIDDSRFIVSVSESGHMTGQAPGATASLAACCASISLWPPCTANSMRHCAMDEV